MTTGVGGGPATLNDYSRVTRERIPLVVAAITLATFLVLILILRSLPLAAIAVGLNLATVGVAFGILTILTDVPDGWPLGGHTYVDSVGATMIFGIVFGLSIDYAVFLLVRMREHYDREGDNRAAIMFGLEKTARVITGAAAIMMAVFVVFAGASIATVSQLGVGLTVAVLLDATVVRIVLLPALMLLIGDRVWWLPKWLDRSLPASTSERGRRLVSRRGHERVDFQLSPRSGAACGGIARIRFWRRSLGSEAKGAASDDPWLLIQEARRKARRRVGGRHPSASRPSLPSRSS